MHIKKEGLPEENEIVVCTVTKIHFHSVFVNLDEYNKSGMIHISEISPGRIRNLRDYVKEGKVIICKVLKVNEQRGHIDLSLRRVNENQRKEKVNETKQDQKAEKIIKYVAEQKKQNPKDLIHKIFTKVSKNYDSIYLFFEDFIAGNSTVSSLKLDKETSDLLEETIRQRIKPPEVVLYGNMSISNYNPEGVEIIKDILTEFDKKEDLFIRYQGGGNYSFQVISDNYKDAENILKKNSDSIIKKLEKKKCIVSYAKV